MAAPHPFGDAEKQDSAELPAQDVGGSAWASGVIAAVGAPVFVFGICVLSDATTSGSRRNGLGAPLLLVGLGLLAAAVVMLIRNIAGHLARSSRQLADGDGPLPLVTWLPGGVSALQAGVLLSSLTTLLVAALVAFVASDAVSGDNPYSTLEFAGSAAEAQAVIASWDAVERAAVACSAGLHFLAVFVYPLPLGVWNLRVSTIASARRSPRLAAAANAVSMVSLPMASCYICSVAAVTALLLARDGPAETTALAASAFITSFFALMLPSLFFAIATSIYLCAAGHK